MLKKLFSAIICLLCIALNLQYVYAEKSPVAAKLKGVRIYQNEVYALTESYIKQIKRLNPDKAFSDSELVEMNRRNLEQIIEKSILIREAEKFNIQPLKSQMYERLQIIIQGIYDDDTTKLIKQLEEDGNTFENYKEQLMQIVLMENVKEHLFREIEISDSSCMEYYKNNSMEFSFECRRVRHILVEAPEMDDETRGLKSVKTMILEKYPEIEDAEKESLIKEEFNKRHSLADSLRNLIISGSGFPEIAEKFSDDDSKTQGGDLGRICRGQTYESFDSVSFTLTTGAISEIVRTPFGFHIIKADTDIESGISPFEEVNATIHGTLRAQRERDIMEALKRKYKVRIKWAF
ncbi:MAG: peptidylprolyl isomerase [bacterium]